MGERKCVRSCTHAEKNNSPACTRKEKARVPSIRLQTGALEGEICPVMAVNEGCGGAVTLCLAGTRELQEATRGGGHGHCVLI